MFVPDLDVSTSAMEQQAFDLNAHMHVLQSTQELRDQLSNSKDTSSVTQEVKKSPKAGCLQEPGELVRAKIPNKDTFVPAYRALVPVLGVIDIRTVLLPALPGSKKQKQVSIENIKPV